MGYCKRIKRYDLKWYQRLWNILTGHKEKNYRIIEVETGGGKCDEQN